jgi:outer membrane protein OmpA-like peptidoglycan-associated protein
MRSIVLSMVLLSALNAGVYDYGYNGVSEVSNSDKNNSMYYGNFDRVIRYDAINYTPSNPVRINKESAELDKMYQSIDGYTQAKVPYKISLIGHTRRDKEIDHEVAQESTFFGSLQNSVMESVSNADDNRAACERAIDEIKKQLVDHNVQESNIVTECREGSQPIYLENDEDARDRNYRVMVALYAPKTEKAKPKAVPVAKPAPVVVPAVVEADSDGDGVVDSKDQCPNTPKGYKVDDNGCPREVTLHINFATNLFAIPSSAYKDIDELKRFMNDYPMYTIEIIGHTDSVGSDSSNKVLSEKRAKSLETLLVKEGIAANRMSSTGMGETKPIASNDDEAGRAQNRRTEVILHATSGN